MRYPVVLDVETQHSFREFSEHKKLRISVACLYDYKDNVLKAYFENELSSLFQILENASVIIGYNINSFDLPVLQAYYPGNVAQFKTFDMLDEVRNLLGRRLALNDLISVTLNKKKSGHGLQAIDLFREGKLEDLKNYCFDDVMLEKELYEYGVKNNEIYFMDVTGKATLKVNWSKNTTQSANHAVSLTLPFTKF